MTDRDDGRIAIVIIAMAASNLGLFGKGFDNPIGQTISSLIASVILLAFLVVFRPSALFWHRRGRALSLFSLGLVWICGVAIVRAMFVTTVSDLPTAPDLFLPKFLATTAGLLFLVIGAILGQRSTDRRLAVMCLAVCITISMAAGLALMILPAPHMMQGWRLVEQGRLLGLAGNANVTAAIAGAGTLLCAAMGLPEWLAKARAFFDESERTITLRASVAAAGCLVNFVALSLTASRFGVLATGVALLLLYIHHGWTTRLPRRSMMIELAVIAAVLLLALYASSALLVDRAERIAPDAFTRWSVWRHFAAIGGVAPWTGFGSGSFAAANIYFLQNSSADLRQIWIINSPHSILLQLWFVGGIPYLILMLGGAGFVVHNLLRETDFFRCSTQHAGLLLAAIVIFAIGLIDIPLDVTASADLACLLVGLAWGREGRRAAVSTHGSA